MSRSLAVIAVLLSACSSSPPKGSTSGGGGPAGSSSGATGNGTGASNGTGVGSGSSSGSGSGSSGGTATGGNGSGPNIEAYYEAYSTALCDFNFLCQADAQYYLNLCMSYTAPGYGDLPAAVDAGRIGYSAAKGQMCLDLFTEAPCFGPPPPEQAACLETLRGLVVPGGVCYSTADCSGGFCQSSNGCAGTCAQWAEINQPCSETLPCDTSSYLSCIDGKCAAAREREEKCGPTLPACNALEGLACIANSCQATPVPLTGFCVFGQGDCAAGSYCYQKAGQAAGVCTEQVQLGLPCAEDADHLKNAFSAADFECQGGYQVTQCVEAGTLLDGGFATGSCTTTSGEGLGCPDVPPEIDLTKPFGSGCSFGLDCAGPTGFATCDRTAVAGKKCYPLPFPCDPTKAFCDFDSGLCEQAFRTGVACTGPGQCGVLNVCDLDAGTCQPPTGPGCSPAF